MKKILTVFFLLTAIAFSACSKDLTKSSSEVAKDSQNKISQNEKNGAVPDSQQGTVVNFSVNGTGSAANSAQGGFQPTAPKLTPAQTVQVNEKVSSVINDVNKILNSLEEAKELDLSGL